MRAGADRDRQSDLGAHPGADLLADGLGRTEQMDRAGHVEERFVDGDALHEWREVAQHCHDLVAQALVVGEVPLDERQVRAQAPGPPSGHAALHPEPFGFVRRGKYHAAADRDRTPAQRRMQELFDGCVEGIEIGVQDRGTSGHDRSLVEQVFVRQKIVDRLMEGGVGRVLEAGEAFVDVGRGQPESSR